MIINRKINTKLISKKRLLPIYISLIKEHNKQLVFDNNKLKDILKQEFNYEVSLEEIINYFEPNFYEYRLDKELQMKNLQIRYD